MKGRSIKIKSDEHWHDLRKNHIGGSESAIILGVHPTRTILDLWAEKTGKTSRVDLDLNERVYFGKLLEPIVAKATAERTGWTIKKTHRYISGMPESRIGASLDYESFCPDRGPGVLECKCADRLEFSKWDPEDGVPIHYMCQLQLYLGLTGKAWGAIAVLVGGNRLEIFDFEAKPTLFDLIAEETEKFWESVERDEPPEPDFEKDAKLLSLIHRDYTIGKSIDLAPDGRAAELAMTYLETQRIARDADKAQTKARAELFHLLGDAESARAGKFEISSGLVAGKPDWHIGFGDVGRVVPGRRAYRTIHIKEKL